MKGYIKRGGILVCLLLLSACTSLGALLPAGPKCVAYGATVKWSDGHPHYSAGCVESAPYPGMPRPGVDFQAQMKYNDNRGLRVDAQHPLGVIHDESPDGVWHEWHPENSLGWVWTWPQLDKRRQMDT